MIFRVINGYSFMDNALQSSLRNLSRYWFIRLQLISHVDRFSVTKIMAVTKMEVLNRRFVKFYKIPQSFSKFSKSIKVASDKNSHVIWGQWSISLQQGSIMACQNTNYVWSAVDWPKG